MQTPASQRKYRAEHREEFREYWRKYRIKNSEKISKINHDASLKRKIEVLSYYCKGNSPECACCSERKHEFLTIDHINGGGGKHLKQINGHITAWLKKNNYPDGYRVLCLNCNFALGHFGYCPHIKSE